MRPRARRRASLREIKNTPAAPPDPVSQSPFSWQAFPWLTPLGWVSLVGIAVFFLGTPWRKWPDPMIDFGRELYLPWRLAHGAVLYRDVDDFFGPLSQYFNSVLFRLFAPGMMVLV